MDSSIRAAELDYKLALEETSLVALQQDQARLFSKLELALADHQVAIEKVKKETSVDMSLFVVSVFFLISAQVLVLEKFALDSVFFKDNGV